MVELGEEAPNTTVKLVNMDNSIVDVNLSDIYDKHTTTVFYFFPAAFTGVCTDSSCQLRDDHKEFTELGAGIYGISADMPATHRVFRNQNEINYPLLSDWNKNMIEAFDIVDDNFGGLKGVPKRSLFAISNGNVIYKWIAEHPGKYPPFEELKSTIDSKN